VTPEDTIVCLCARQHFDGNHRRQVAGICQDRKIRWNAVFHTAEQHGVSPLVLASLKKCGEELGIPSEVLASFKRSAVHSVFVQERTTEVLTEVLALFARKGIDLMLVKGAALSRVVYAQPWYTRFADIDLIINAGREEIGEADRGEIIATLEGFNDHPGRFQLHIEYDFLAHHDVTMNDLLPVDSQRVWHEARRIRIGEHDAFVMAPEDMVIAACVNSCRHRFFRLKSLCDIAEIIERFPDLDWDALISKARQYECNTILYTAFVVAQMTLGCSLPDRLFSDLEVNPVRAFVIRRVAARLWQSLSLTELFTRSEGALLDRAFSWPLFLVYATYRVDQASTRLTSLCRSGLQGRSDRRIPRRSARLSGQVVPRGDGGITEVNRVRAAVDCRAVPPHTPQ